MFKANMSLLALCISATPFQAATVDLHILETTDLHSNMMDFDYYKDTPIEKFGLVRTATLIQQAQAKAKNSVLVGQRRYYSGQPAWRLHGGERTAEGRSSSGLQSAEHAGLHRR